MPPAARTEMVSLILTRMRTREEGTDRSSEAMEAFRTVARWITRSISLFLDMNAAMCAALPSDDEPIDEIDTENFNRIMEMHPHFPELIAAFKEEPDTYDSFIGILVRAMGDARAQDTNILRYEIPRYIPLNYATESVMPPITGGEKSGRGFSHPATGKLLCPLRYLDRFQADPILFKNQVENASIRLRALDERNWPSFLYPEGTVYDELELEKGLFRGHVFLRALRTIYTGRSSAFTGHRSASKPSQAEKHGMRKVFPEAVAYAAVQCYYSLSSLDGWNTEDRFFELDVFFDKCVLLFTEDPKDEWVIDTLTFLTSNMPALTRKAKRRHFDPQEEEEGSENEAVVGILDRRAARRQTAQEAEKERQRQQATDNTDSTNEDDQPLPRRLTPPNSSAPASPIRGRASSRTSPSRHVRPGSNSRSPSPEQFPQPSSTANTQSTMSRNQATQSRAPLPPNEGTSFQGSRVPFLEAASTNGRQEHEVPPPAPKRNATKKPAKRRKW